MVGNRLNNTVWRHIQENESALICGLAILECPVWSHAQIYSNFLFWSHFAIFPALTIIKMMMMMMKMLVKLFKWRIGSNHADDEKWRRRRRWGCMSKFTLSHISSYDDDEDSHQACQLANWVNPRRQAWQLKNSISFDVFINPTSTKIFMHHWHRKQHSK